jgi:hypothetical protein
MWASVSFIRIRQTNPRTERQESQQRQFFEFDRNWTRELIIIWSNRMARACEQACHSYEQDKPIHVLRYSWVNNVSSPSWLGIEPVSWLSSDGREWQGHVSKRDIHMNKTNHQSTYWETANSTTSVFRVRSELSRPWVHYNLMEQNGKEMWASGTCLRTIWTNPRTKRQLFQPCQCSELARNWTRKLILIWSNRMARTCEQACHSCIQDKPIHVPRYSWVNNVSSPSSFGIEPVSWL